MNDKDTDVVDLLKYLALPEFSSRRIGVLEKHDSGREQIYKCFKLELGLCLS